MAFSIAPRVRETSSTVGTGSFTLSGAMYGSLAFSQVLSTGDTCGYCASYGAVFEEGLGTYQADGTLARTTVYKSRHLDGTVDTNKVSFAAGIKTIVLVASSAELSTHLSASRAQSFTTGQKRQALDNLGFLPSGTAMLFVQAAAPTGWTKDFTYNDRALRVVSAIAGGGGGGVQAFSTVFSRTATDLFNLQVQHLPAYFLPATVTDTRTWRLQDPQILRNWNGVNNDLPYNPDGGFIMSLSRNSPVEVASGSISTSVHSGGSGFSLAAGMDIRVQYCDAIICTKD
jgi:hypothetical protein